MAATPSFNWYDFLALAKSLSANADAASQRTAISRAYYSVFHAATLRGKSNGYTEHSHSRLWKMYQADADVNARRLSTIGNQMKTAREAADYKAQVSRVGDLMASQLDNADQFAKFLEQLPATSPQPLPPTKRTCPSCGALQP
jgi:uncharacterized protein (UPF0332 family)